MLPRLLTLAVTSLAALLAFGAVRAVPGHASVWVFIAAMAALAAVRPGTALIAAAAFVPLGGAMAALAGLRNSPSDALVLAMVVGWFTRRTAIGGRWDVVSAALAGLLAAVVAASLLVQCLVVFDVAAPADASWPRMLIGWLTGASRVRDYTNPPVVAAARLLAGLGVFVMAVDVCRREPATAGRALRLLAIAVTAIAALNVVRFVELVVRRDASWGEAAFELHQFVRVSSTIPDVNAAGALFALVLPATLVAALGGPRRRRAAAAGAAALLATGLWLTGSRAAMAAAAVGVVASLGVAGWRVWPRRRLVLASGVLIAAMAALVVWYPRSAAHTPSTNAWEIRRELARVALQMTKASPVFGVGIGRFLPESAGLASAALREHYAAENAHNQLLQVLGELGLTGAALFLAVLASGLVPPIRAAGRLLHTPSGTGAPPPQASLAAPLAIGLLSFLGAGLLMHPLLVAEVSAAFWLALGLARAAGAPALEPTPWAARRTGVVAAMAAVAIMATAPHRATLARDALDLDGVGVGLTRWNTDHDAGIRYRSAEGPAAIHIDARAGRIDLPVRLRHGSAPGALLDVRLDGREAGRFRVYDGRWTTVSFVVPSAPSSHARFRRLDVRVDDPGATLDLGREEAR